MAQVETSRGGATRQRRWSLILFAPLLAMIALGAWAFASPVGSSPDDDYHLVSIWCAAGERTSLCEEGANRSVRMVSESLLSAPCFARDSTESGACQLGQFDDAPLVESSRGNFSGAYPPVFYGTMSLLATDDVQTSSIAMRMANIGILVAFMTVLWVFLPSRHARTMVWSWLITVIPLGLFLIASNNPSSWAVIGVGTAWVALLGYYETAGRSRAVLGTVFAAGVLMAAGSRADAAVYVILATLAVGFLSFQRNRRFALLSILPVAGIVVAVAVAVAAGQLSSAVDGFSGSAAPTVPTPAESPAQGTARAVAGSSIGLFVSNLVNAPSLWAGVFGYWSLGWFDTPLPAIVAFGGVGVFAAVTFSGIGVLSWRKALVTAGAVAAVWVIPVWTLTRGGDVVGVEVQPRYLLPLIVLIAGFALLSVGRRELRLSLAQRVLVAGTLIGTQSLALFVTLRRFVTGDDVNGLDLNAGIEWWWAGAPSPMIVWILGSLAWALLVFVLVRRMSSELSEHPRSVDARALL